jgi:membrane protease YdiL (CAAX protease family)
MNSPDTNASQLPSRDPDRVKQALRGGGWVGFLVLIVILGITYLFGPRVSAPVVLLWAWWTGLPWRDLGFRRPKSWTLVIVGGIVAGAAAKLLMKAVVMRLLGAPDLNTAYQWLVHNTAALPGMLFTAIVFAGFFEEVIARGFLFERMGRLIGTSRIAIVATILIASTLFGAAHYPEQHWPGAVQAFILALVEGVIFVRTRQLWFLVAMHAAFDIVAMFIIYFGLETNVAHAIFH